MLSINQMWICTGLNTLSPYNKESKSSCNLCYGIFSFKVLVPGRSGRGQSPRLESRSRATRVLAEVTRAREAIVFKMRLPTGQWRTWSRSWGSAATRSTRSRFKVFWKSPETRPSRRRNLFGKCWRVAAAEEAKRRKRNEEALLGGIRPLCCAKN